MKNSEEASMAFDKFLDKIGHPAYKRNNRVRRFTKWELWFWNNGFEAGVASCNVGEEALGGNDE